jgi:hypothetical protein
MFTQEDAVLQWAEANLQAPDDRIVRLALAPKGTNALAPVGG